jgi:hypothetical protein
MGSCRELGGIWVGGWVIWKTGTVTASIKSYYYERHVNILLIWTYNK